MLQLEMARPNLEEEKDVLFNGRTIQCFNSLLKEGIGGLYRGYFKKGSPDEREVAVRRIKMSDCRADWKDAVYQCKTEFHINVSRIYGYDQDPLNYRYFAIEMFEATLEQAIKGKYPIPMTSDAQILYQIANGIEYLHSRNLKHGNLNPHTIHVAQSLSLRLKISELGLLSQYIYFDPKSTTAVTSHPTCWMSSKSWSISEVDGVEIIKSNPTEASDHFAAGCIFFYFLRRGLHPFGSHEKNTILSNIEKKDAVNLKELDENHFAFQPIRDLIEQPPTIQTERLRFAVFQFKQFLPLQIDEEKPLGQGANGKVFAGYFEGKPVAVKRIEAADMNPKMKELIREVQEHKLLKHRNVVELLYVDDERNAQFRYLVLELCAGTLRDFCKKKYVGPMPQDLLVLHQIASGLHYIHSMHLVHRDVKPANVLISISSPVQMKLSDFGLVKRTSSRGTYSQSNIKGTVNWMAPEILELLETSCGHLPHGSIKSDVFSSGCVFFYFLSRGSHPFAKPHFCPKPNILKNNPEVFDHHVQKLRLNGQQDFFSYDIIRKMMNFEVDRISLPEVIDLLDKKCRQLNLL